MREDSRGGKVSSILGSLTLNIRRSILLMASLMVATIVGFVVLDSGTRPALLFAASSFVVFYVVLGFLLGDEREKTVEIRRRTINPSRKLLLVCTGLTLLVLSLLGSNIARGPYMSQRPLVDLGWSGLPVILCIIGAVLISFPVMTVRSETFSIDMEVNAAYVVFLLSFTAYLVLKILSVAESGEAATIGAYQQWLLLLSIASGAVFVLAEVVESRVRVDLE